MSAPQMSSKTAVAQFDKEFRRYTTKHVRVALCLAIPSVWLCVLIEL